MPTPYMEEVGNIWLNKNEKAAILNMTVGMIVKPYTHTCMYVYMCKYINNYQK